MAQAECISTAIREPMSRGELPKSTNRVGAAHLELGAALARKPALPIHSQVDSHDLEPRAEPLRGMFAALGVFFSVILRATNKMFVARGSRNEVQPKMPSRSTTPFS